MVGAVYFILAGDANLIAKIVRVTVAGLTRDRVFSVDTVVFLSE